MKQYSTDILVLILCYLYFDRKEKGFETKWDWLKFAGFGVGCIYLSNIAVFVLFILGSRDIIVSLKDRNYRDLYLSTATCLLWVIAFILYFYLFINGNSSKDLMNRFWDGFFMPHNVFSKAWLLWMNNKANMIFTDVFPLIFRLTNYYSNFYIYQLYKVIFGIGLIYLLFKKDGGQDTWHWLPCF